MSDFASLLFSLWSVLRSSLLRRWYRDGRRVFPGTFRRQRRGICGERQCSAYYWNTQIELVILDFDGCSPKIGAEIRCSRRGWVAIEIYTFKFHVDHRGRESVDHRRLAGSSGAIESYAWSIDHVVFDSVLVLYVEHGKTRSCSGCVG